MIFLVSNIFTFFSQPWKPRWAITGQHGRAMAEQITCLHSHELSDVDIAELQHPDGIFGDNKNGKLQKCTRATCSPNYRERYEPQALSMQ